MKRLDVLWPSCKQHGPQLVSHTPVAALSCLTHSFQVFFDLPLGLRPGASTWLILDSGSLSCRASVGMATPGQSTPSHSQQKIFKAASSQYVCAGHPICEWQTTHFPERASVATLQKAFFFLCEGPRCCTIGHGSLDAGIISPNAVFQWGDLVTEQTVQFSPLETRHRYSVSQRSFCSSFRVEHITQITKLFNFVDCASV